MNEADDNQEYIEEGEDVLDESILESLGIDLGSDISSFHNIVEMAEKLRNRKVYIFGDICTYNILVVIYQINI